MLGFFILFGSLNVFSISVSEVKESVLKNFLLIQEAELKLKSSEGEVIASEGSFDHKLSFKMRNRIEDKYANQYFESTLERQTPYGGSSLVLGHRQGIGQFPAYDGKYKTSGAGEIFAGLSIPVLRNFKTDDLRTDLNLKRIDQKIAKIELSFKKMIYVHKAISLLYKYALERKKLEISKEILDLAISRHEMIQKRFKIGDVEKIKLTDNQRSIDKRKSVVLKNEVSYQKVRAQLGIYLRDELGNMIFSEENVNVDDLLTKNENLIKISNISANPQFELLNLESEKLRLELANYQQQKLPGLNLEVLGAREIAPNDPYDQEALQLGLKFDLPLENRKAEGKSVSYFYKLKSLEKRRSFLQVELLQNFNFFLQASSDSRKRWDVTSNEYQESLRMAEAERKKWLEGASNIFIVNLREEDIADVNTRRWTALYDYHQYHLDALLFSGKILEVL
jgi:hypothetical protein